MSGYNHPPPVYHSQPPVQWFYGPDGHMYYYGPDGNMYYAYDQPMSADQPMLAHQPMPLPQTVPLPQTMPTPRPQGGPQTRQIVRDYFLRGCTQNSSPFTTRFINGLDDEFQMKEAFKGAKDALESLYKKLQRLRREGRLLRLGMYEAPRHRNAGQDFTSIMHDLRWEHMAAIAMEVGEVNFVIAEWRRRIDEKTRLDEQARVTGMGGSGGGSLGGLDQPDIL